MVRPINSILALLLCVLANLSYAQLDRRTPSGLDSQLQSAPVPLSQQQAFPYYVSETGPAQLRVTWDLAPGHYLYRHAFNFSLQPASDDSSLRFSLPDGLRKTDQFFGEIEAYYNQVSAEIVLPSDLPADAILIIEYQGCADWGFCYPPQRRQFTPNP